MLSTQAASPLQQCPANPRSQHCAAPEHGSARSRPGARPGRGRARRGTRPPGPGQRPGHGRHCPKAMGSVRGMRAARQLRLQLFVRAADGSAERSRLCPAMAALTSKCTLSPRSIIVSSVPTIALWCCIVLLPPLAPSTGLRPFISVRAVLKPSLVGRLAELCWRSLELPSQR